jgi:endonuclease/exonuclease/phosphatase family metal-dependent hydrolase
MKTFLKAIFLLVVFAFLAFASLIFYATFSNYEPAKQEIVFESSNTDVNPLWPEIDLMIWNIGYCGLSSDMDFFYDGGEKVRTSKEQVVKNLDSIINVLQSNDTIEFFLLQEVDVKSKRSYNICEFDSIAASLLNYQASFGKNYDVFFVPLPPSEPMGKVKSGLQTLSKTTPSSSIRWSFPGKFAWPKSLFMLDRCFLVNRYSMAGGKELLIINTHNSAYDAGGVLRTQEMKYLKEFLISEYKKGNYVLVGGDWNQSPPGFKPEFTSDVFDNIDFTLVPDGYLPDGWKWAFDPSVPSNRRLMTSFQRGKTPTTIIDFFLLSPNIEMVTVKTIDKEFRNSDHQPVKLKIRLLK